MIEEAREYRWDMYACVDGEFAPSDVNSILRLTVLVESLSKWKLSFHGVSIRGIHVEAIQVSAYFSLVENLNSAT